MEWYQSFFTSLALDFWRAAVPAEATSDEVAFLVSELGVSPPAYLLDLPCGLGRHVLALASRGYRVTGVDLSSDAISAAKEEARGHDVAASFLLGDMRDTPPNGPYEGAYCFGNSFGYLSHRDTKRFIRNVFDALRPGARWVIDTGAAAECLLPHLVSKRTLDAGGITYSVHNRYDAVSGRLVQSCTLVRDGQRQNAEISQAIYTVAELHRLLQGEGWQITGTYGSLDGKPFALGDRRLLLVAQRPG